MESVDILPAVSHNDKQCASNTHYYPLFNREMEMLKPITETQYAPAVRSSAEAIARQASQVRAIRRLDDMLSAMPSIVMILNENRQIVYANEIFLAAVKAVSETAVLGKRTGEALRCTHADDGPGGCGTSHFCSTCGAVNAILKAQTGHKDVQECRISVDVNDETQALDLRVWATPFVHGDTAYTIFAAQDISSEKRRRVLERLFFHDIINTAGAIQGLAYTMETLKNMEEVQEFGLQEMLAQASTQLINEINAQKQLLEAENGDLQPQPAYIETFPFLQSVIDLYARHPAAACRYLALDPTTVNLALQTDKGLLGRVIGNMVKNALEAAQPNDVVTVGCEQLYEYVRFWVHNPTFMPRRVQLQVFQRSFSTKGNGRGLGTYSMKLLSENYLQGRVSFTSTQEEGTTFMGMFPLLWSEG